MNNWKIEKVWYPAKEETRYRILAGNGQWVAECKTMASAERVKRGLFLDAEETKKMKNFRI